MRRDIRGGLLCVAALALNAAAVRAQDAPAPAPTKAAARPAAKAAAPAAARPNPERMKQLLQVWEQQSAKIKTLDVGIKRVDKSPAWGNETFEGRAILRSPNLAWLDFQTVETDDAGKAKKPVPHERIICTGTEVWQYLSKTKQIFIFPLDKQNQKRALEEGPLPFLFNMKAAEAQARYQMDLATETADFFVVSVLPKEKIDRESFSKAFVQLNRKTFLPDRIVLISPDGKSTKDFTLNRVQPNAEVKDSIFKGVVYGKDWQVVRDAAPQAQAQPQPGRPAAPAGGAVRRR